MSVDKTLDERGARYGEFIQHAEIAQGLQAVLAKMPNWPTLDYDMRQALCVICDKIARIGNGDPYYADNWHDIQGYAKLVETRILALPSDEQELFPGSITQKEVIEELNKSAAVPNINETRQSLGLPTLQELIINGPKSVNIEDVFDRIGKAISDKPKGYYEA